MTHDELLAAYGDEYGVPDCRLDAAGRAAFEFADGVLVYAESHPAEEVLLLHAAVAEVVEPDSRLLMLLLGNNYFYRGRKSTVTGFNIATREITVLLGLDTSAMGPSDLEAALESLLDDVAYWRELVNEGEKAWSDVSPGVGILPNFGVMGMA